MVSNDGFNQHFDLVNRLLDHLSIDFQAEDRKRKPRDEMKYLSGHLGYALQDTQLRQNLGGLLRYFIFLMGVILLYSVLFHVIMVTVEGQEHSWLTGFYWTLTVMSTLGFGDITFSSDLGRLFSILVLFSGIILLLIVLPFAFIRYFYAPWLEAQLRLRAPLSVPTDTRGHVVFTAWDTVSQGLAPWLEAEGIPHWVIEEDGATAARMHGDEVPVVRGILDDVETYRRLRAQDARLVVLAQDDLTNTNLALTIREISDMVTLAAFVEDEHAIDILEMAGCDHAIPIKKRLGEHLANRVSAGHAQAHIIGEYGDLVLAEFSAHDTPFAGKTIREASLREIAGLSVVGVWERGKVLPGRPDTPITALSILVVAGSRDSMERLNEFLWIYDTNWNPVVVIGEGKVGQAVAAALKRRGIPVHVVERDPSLASALGDLPDRLVVGDAADREVMRSVGVEEAPSIILTTNDDATNIYLAAYSRRLNPEARIVSRITHDRNLASIQRAGADLTLSYTTLGVETLHSLLNRRLPILLAEGIGFHEFPCPSSLEGSTLQESGIGQRTGLTVIALETGDTLLTDPGPRTVLTPGSTLLAIGSHEQALAFRETFS
ncbi:MAG: NAD-binding protein [Longimicrobiales bacterium]